jgi:hypothetical protein
MPGSSPGMTAEEAKFDKNHSLEIFFVPLYTRALTSSKNAGTWG